MVKQTWRHKLEAGDLKQTLLRYRFISIGMSVFGLIPPSNEPMMDFPCKISKVLMLIGERCISNPRMIVLPQPCTPQYRRAKSIQLLVFKEKGEKSQPVDSFGMHLASVMLSRCTQSNNLHLHRSFP